VQAAKLHPYRTPCTVGHHAILPLLGEVIAA
jgi:hypothetical protein